MHSRQASSSSFAEAFDAAWNWLGPLTFQVADFEEESSSVSSPTPSSTDSEVPVSPVGCDSLSDAPTSLASPLSTPISPISPKIDTNVADNFASAFDIDGVLVRGGRPIPEAIEAMKVFNGENEFGTQVYVPS
jgi:hypothetical protein